MQVGQFFGEDQARHVIAKRVLLPVDEVLTTTDFQAVASTGVRQCGAGFRRMVCGASATGRSKL